MVVRPRQPDSDSDKDSNATAEDDFRHYTVVMKCLACPIPDAMPFENAAALPSALSTASCGLFQTDQVGLRHPTVNAERTGQALLVGGGLTSIVSNAIQLVVAAGYEIFTTASAHNAEQV